MIQYFTVERQDIGRVFPKEIRNELILSVIRVQFMATILWSTPARIHPLEWLLGTVAVKGQSYEICVEGAFLVCFDRLS
jgi:hypothetical protein